MSKEQKWEGDFEISRVVSDDFGPDGLKKLEERISRKDLYVHDVIRNSTGQEMIVTRVDGESIYGIIV